MGLNLELSQKLIMTPQLCQAITILQLSATELADLVQQELLDNPVLDQKELPRHDNIESVQLLKPERAPDYFDWADYFNESGSRSFYQSAGQTEPEGCDVADGGTSLHEHLELQLDFAGLSADEQAAGRFLIGCIDDNGYFTGTVEEAATALKKTESLVEHVLTVIQGFDPSGVGARNLRECLRIQLRMRGISDPVVDGLVESYLEEAASGRFAWIAGKMGVTVEAVRRAMQFIRTLDPKPGSAISGTSTCSYVTPDVTIRNIDGEYVIIINETRVPSLHVNPYYRRLVRETDGETRRFLESRIGAAVWLIRSIEQRRQTMYRLMETLIELQRPFFDHGSRQLRPMTMKQVADQLGVHESTVSRATANKYVDTPHGLFSLRSFFSAGVSGVDGSTLSATRVKREIRDIVAKEDSTRPYSDQALTEMLTRSGIAVSRRTVAKYREELDILPSCRRKK